MGQLYLESLPILAIFSFLLIHKIKMHLTVSGILDPVKRVFLRSDVHFKQCSRQSSGCPSYPPWFLLLIPMPCVSPLTQKKTDLCKPTGCYRRDWVWLLIKDLSASVLFSFGSLILEEASFHPVRMPKQFHGEVDARGKTTCQQPGQTCSVTQSRPTLCDPMDRSRSMGFSRPEYWSGLPFPSACQAWEWTI